MDIERGEGRGERGEGRRERGEGRGKRGEGGGGEDRGEEGEGKGGKEKRKTVLVFSFKVTISDSPSVYCEVREHSLNLKRIIMNQGT